MMCIWHLGRTILLLAEENGRNYCIGCLSPFDIVIGGLSMHGQQRKPSRSSYLYCSRIKDNMVKSIQETMWKFVSMILNNMVKDVRV